MRKPGSSCSGGQGVLYVCVCVGGGSFNATSQGPLSTPSRFILATQTMASVSIRCLKAEWILPWCKGCPQSHVHQGFRVGPYLANRVLRRCDWIKMRLSWSREGVALQ